MMTGLEKILKHIEDEALANVEKILNDAKQKRDSILTEAKEAGTKRCAEIEKKSVEEVHNILNRAKSAAELEERRLILSAKQNMIEQVIQKAMNKLIKLPDDDYFKIILSLIRKYATSETGQIIFAETDKKRLPKDFEQRVFEILKDKKNAELTVANETCDICGGFILSYGDMEVNCSFEALFLAEKENLVDKVRAELFD